MYFFIKALVAVFLFLLLLDLNALEGLQQLFFPLNVSVVPGSEALQQLQHFHYFWHQTLDALFTVSIDKPLHLGPDEFGDFINIVDCQQGDSLVKVALARVSALRVGLHV